MQAINFDLLVIPLTSGGLSKKSRMDEMWRRGRRSKGWGILLGMATSGYQSNRR